MYTSRGDMGNPEPTKKPFFDDPETEALRLEIQKGIDARFSEKDIDDNHEEIEDEFQ